MAAYFKCKKSRKLANYLTRCMSGPVGPVLSKGWGSKSTYKKYEVDVHHLPQLSKYVFQRRGSSITWRWCRLFLEYQRKKSRNNLSRYHDRGTRIFDSEHTPIEILEVRWASLFSMNWSLYRKKWAHSKKRKIELEEEFQNYQTISLK